jgi:carbonic anhydrase
VRRFSTTWSNDVNDTISASTLKSDISAGVIVFLVALPLCLGIALASGAPLFSGIIAGVVGGVLVGILSGSHVSVSGPAAGLTAVVLSGIHSLGSYELMLVAIVLAGIIQIGLGFAKVGSMAEYFPSSVIQGMLTAIGIIIIIKQIPHGLGYDANAEFLDEYDTGALDVFNQALSHISPGATTLCLLSIALMLLWDRPAIKRMVGVIPAGLAVVLAGVAINEFLFKGIEGWFIGDEHRVHIPVPKSFAEFGALFLFPDFSAALRPDILVVAFTVAAVASIETLLCIEACDRIDPQRRVTPTNRELVAQGSGNIVSGLLGGLPVTSVIVRSSANVHAGAKTKNACIVHGALLAVTVLAIPGIMNMIPLASLAAILLMVGYKLAQPGMFRKLYAKGYEQFLPFVVTIAAILATDLLKGVGVGLCVSIFMILRRNILNSGYSCKESSGDSGVLLLRLSEEVSFLNKASIRRVLDHVPGGCRLQIDASESRHIDPDVVEILREFIDIKAPQRKIEVDLLSLVEKHPEVAQRLLLKKAV